MPNRLEDAPTQSQCCQVKTHTPLYSCNLVMQSNKCTSNLRAVGHRATLQPPGLSVRGTFPTGKMTNMYVAFGHPCLCFGAVKKVTLKAFPFLLSIITKVAAMFGSLSKETASHPFKKLHKENLCAPYFTFFVGKLNFFATTLDWKSGLQSTRGSSICRSLQIQSAGQTGLKHRNSGSDSPAQVPARTYLGVFILTALITSNSLTLSRTVISASPSFITFFLKSSLFSGPFNMKLP